MLVIAFYAHKRTKLWQFQNVHGHDRFDTLSVRLILSLAEEHAEVAHSTDRTGNKVIALVSDLCFGQILQNPKLLGVCKKLFFERKEKTVALSLGLKYVFSSGFVDRFIYSLGCHNYIPLFFAFFLIISQHRDII